MKCFLAIITFIAMSLSVNSQYLGAPQYQPGVAPPAPVYSAKPNYGPVHAGPATSYTYPSPAPPVPCPTNLLLSCAPSVAPVPCQSVHYEKQPAYAKPAYAQQGNFP